MTATVSPARSASAAPRRAAQPRGVLGLSILIVFLTLIPYLCGYLLSPPHRVFLGALNNVGDLSQYLAAIRQGSEGAWRYTNQFTPERSHALLMYLPYMLAGKASLGLSAAAVFQLLRLVCALACLAALASFCRLFVGAFALRVTWLFVLMAGGLYWLALLISPFGLHFVEPVKLTAPELSPLITLLISPHESLGLAAELAGFALFLRAVGAHEPLWVSTRSTTTGHPRSEPRLLLGAAGSFLALALSYPFLLPTVGLVLLACIGLNALGARSTRPATATRKRELRAGEVFLTDLRRLIVVMAPAGIVGAYYWQVFRHDPLWSQSKLTTIGSPDYGVLLFAFGPLALGAWFGARRLQAWRAGGDSIPFALAGFPIIWAIVNACTLVLPIWQQGRQALGFSVPLALLCFLALAGLPAETPRGHATLPSLPAIPAATLGFSSSLLFALYTAITAGGVNQSYYAPSDVIQAVNWLGTHADTADVVLASAGFSNLIPTQCSCRVVIGQNFETFHWEKHQQQVLKFYGARTRATAKAALHTLVTKEGVTYYVISSFERNLGSIDLTRMPGFTLRFREPTASVFQLTPAHG